jgi:8-oxo-dGTP pyrophosphatase MutT (NUDIX family)
MSYFTLANFIDKDVACLPPTHRFADLAKNLMAYQGMDILPLTQGDNELLQGKVRAKADTLHAQLLQSPPLPDACVLILITDESVPKLLLTKRASNLSSHAGEVALVGGKRDDTDGSSWGVALREAHEEVGLSAEDTTLIGYLPMQLSKKGLLVRPVVAVSHADVKDKLHPSEDEIADVFWLSLAFLQQNPPVDWVFYRTDIGRRAMNLHTPAWLIQDDKNPDNPNAHVLWGLTGRILANLLEIGYGIKYPWYYRLKPAD